MATGLKHASGYADQTGLGVCNDYRGVRENIYCETVFAKMPSGKMADRLLPDIASMNKPRTFLVTSTPTVFPLEVNGQLRSSVSTACELTYSLNGASYTRIKHDMMDKYENTAASLINAQNDKNGERALAADFDMRIACSLPAMACAGNMGANAGLSGLNLGTLSNPVALSSKEGVAGTTYVLDYLTYGSQVMQERGMLGGVAVSGPTSLKFLVNRSQHATNAQMNGGNSAYFDNAYCDGIQMACGLLGFTSNCQAPVGKDANGKSIYRIIWIARNYFDVAFGVLMKEKNVRDGASLSLFDMTVVRDGFAVSHSEAIAVGYVTL